MSSFLSEKNAERLAETLCRMRGAALKIGQIISIQDESMISPQVQKILSRVRQAADVMPKKQLLQQLEMQLGPGYMGRLLTSFDADAPIAAASIGQVHRAVALADQTPVAMKIQYPGVAASVESDLTNLRRILSVANILPKGLYMDTVITEARKELLQECDYRRELENTLRFRELLKGDDVFVIPRPIPELCTQQIFTNELVQGAVSIEEVAKMDQQTRNHVAFSLLRLCLRELFEFRFMQTDPNWGNFLYLPSTRQLVLLDFGACREYPVRFVDEYLRVVYHSAQRNETGVIESSKKLGFLTGDETLEMNRAHAQAVMIIGEPFAEEEGSAFDFRGKNMTRRINELVPIMLEGRLTAPPIESYSLHRKLSGAFLTCFKLGAVIPCRGVFMDTYRKYIFHTL